MDIKDKLGFRPIFHNFNFLSLMFIPLEDIKYLKKKLYLDNNIIFLDWQKKNLSRVDLKSSVQP